MRGGLSPHNAEGLAVSTGRTPRERGGRGDGESEGTSRPPGFGTVHASMSTCASHNLQEAFLPLHSPVSGSALRGPPVTSLGLTSTRVPQAQREVVEWEVPGAVSRHKYPLSPKGYLWSAPSLSGTAAARDTLPSGSSLVLWGTSRRKNLQR